MKKLYFIVLLCSIVLNAQTVIYSQPVISNNGANSNFFTNGTFIASGDDFKLTSANTIKKITVFGAQYEGTLETTVATGVKLYIYADDNGKPAGIPNNNAVAPIAMFDIAKNTPGYSLTKSGVDYTFTIDLGLASPTPLILQPNTTYWLVFVVNTSLASNSGPKRFNWYAGQPMDNVAKLVNASNPASTTANTWTNISSADGLAFSIEGESVLGTKEIYNSIKQVRIYPNPTSDYLNIRPESKINNVTVLDVTGRKVGVKVDGDRVYVRSLPAGTYLIYVETKDGISAEKFIKK